MPVVKLHLPADVEAWFGRFDMLRDDSRTLDMAEAIAAWKQTGNTAALESLWQTYTKSEAA